jgi:hypothetical protein
MDSLSLCIQWILFARRPFKLQELYFAILSAEPDNLTDAWDPEDIRTEDMSRFLLNTSKGLAEITKSRDKTVQLIHESVRVLLLKENGLQELLPGYRGNFGASSHDQSKECCYNFLQTDIDFPRSHQLPPVSSEEDRALRHAIAEKFPFLEYAVRNVLYHANAAEEGGISQNNFIQGFNLQTWIDYSNTIEKFKIRRHTSSVSLLYILAKYDLAHLIVGERKRASSIDLPGERYHYPVLAALANGNDAAIRALLEPHEIFQGNERLHKAIQRFYRKELAALLQRKKDVKMRKCEALLHFAIEHEETSLAGLLLFPRRVRRSFIGIGIHSIMLGDVNGPGLSMSELELADLTCPTARNGQEEVLDGLLSTYRVNLDLRSDLYNTTALNLAIDHGHEAIVHRILTTGQVDLNLPEAGSGRSLLHLAIDWRTRKLSVYF